MHETYSPFILYNKTKNERKNHDFHSHKKKNFSLTCLCINNKNVFVNNLPGKNYETLNKHEIQQLWESQGHKPQGQKPQSLKSQGHKSHGQNPKVANPKVNHFKFTKP